MRNDHLNRTAFDALVILVNDPPKTIPELFGSHQFSEMSSLTTKGLAYWAGEEDAGGEALWRPTAEAIVLVSQGKTARQVIHRGPRRGFADPDGEDPLGI